MTTDNRPPIRDYSLLFPVFVAILSLIGIGVLVATVWFPRQEAAIIPTQTLTPFKYLFLGTETPGPTPRPETATGSEYFPIVTSERDITTLPASTEQSGTLSAIPLLTLTGQTGTPPAEFSTPTLTITPESIFSGSVPLTTGKYDGADSKIIRTGNWTNQNDSNAYQGTLLVSNTVGNSLAFSFTGSSMQVGYQSSTSAGSMMITLDGSEVTVPQLVGNIWISPSLESGTHYVILTHASGNTLNLDYIVIAE
jgi:hypothetical protein